MVGSSRGRPRDLQVRRVLLLEGLANAAVLTLKVVVGLTAGSLAVLADAIHSLTDSPQARSNARPAGSRGPRTSATKRLGSAPLDA